MSEQDQTRRWLEADGADGGELPEELGALLRAEADGGRVAGADGARLRAVMAGVAAEVQRPELVGALDGLGAGAGAGTPAGAGAGAGTGVALKLVLGIVLAGGVAWLAVPAERPALEPSRPAVAASPSPEPPAPGRQPAFQQQPAPVAEQAPAEPQPATQQPAPKAPRKVRRAGRPGLEPEVVGAGEGDPLQELTLLEQAQRSLRDDPRDALSRADQHRRRYPRGQFAQEREMIAIEALGRLGLSAKARARGRRFMRRFPSSSHVPRLKQLLADPP